MKKLLYCGKFPPAVCGDSLNSAAATSDTDIMYQTVDYTEIIESVLLCKMLENSDRTPGARSAVFVMRRLLFLVRVITLKYRVNHLGKALDPS